MSYRPSRAQLNTFGIAAVGAAVFWWLQLPLPFLFGPMGACLTMALIGAKLSGFGEVGAAARTILGVTIGCSITPDVVSELPRMAGSVALIPLYIAIIGLVGVPFFRHVCKFDAPTAYYAAMPGGLQDMILFGEEAGGNARILSLIHATRILVIVIAAPILMTQVYNTPLTNPIGQPARELPLHEMGLMVLAAWIGWKGGARIGLFGASILGPLILSAVLSLSGFIHSRPPAEAILAAQYFLGATIGAKYVGVTMAELRRVVIAGLAFMLVLTALAAAFAQFVTHLGLAEPVNALLAFAPGGQAELTIVTILAGGDLSYVITHHITRIVLVILGAPIAARLLWKRPDGS